MPRSRPGMGVVVVIVVALLALATPAGAQPRVLEHRTTSFSVRAPAGAKLAFDAHTGAYVVASRRGTVTYQLLRTGASPGRAGRFILSRARLSSNNMRRAPGRWSAALPGGRRLLVRRSGPRRLRVALWRSVRPRGSAASRRWTLTRIARSARGGRAYRLSRAARLMTKARRSAVTLTWKTPAEDATVSGSGVHLAVEASRPSAVDHVTFHVDGVRLAREYDAPYQATLNTTTVSMGAHTLRADAHLSDGRTVSATRRVQVAEQPAAGASGAFFVGDFETGTLTPFRTVQAEAPDRIQVVPGLPFGGRYSARFEVRPGDEAAGGNRAEVTGPSFAEGQTVFFRQAIRLHGESALDGRWQQVVQYSANGVGSPALALFTANPQAGGRYQLELRTGNSSATYWRSPVLERDVWHDVAVMVRFSSSTAGKVSVWFGGLPQTLTSGGLEASASTIHYDRAYYKTGIYRSPSHTGTSLADHDGILMGGSPADVGL